MRTPTILMILDGLGLGLPTASNAVRNAITPRLDALSHHPHCQLSASGLDVGLPEGQMGNSEVGHTNIGAGRVVFQDLPRINRDVETGAFFENEAFLAAMKSCRSKKSALHLIGLLSDGGVHSHIDHLFALLELAKRQGLERVYIHAFLDGRDVSPTSGITFVSRCVDVCNTLGVGTLGTVMGRYYAMDRDKRWDRMQRAYDAIVSGNAPLVADPVAAVQQSYASGITDEFMEPVCCCEDARIAAGDSVIFFNFRPDRARQLTRALVDPDFSDLKRPQGALPLHFVCTTEYDATMPNVTVAYRHEKMANIFGSYISRMGLTQLRIAETEKYPHVTFFFNGGQEEPYPGEDRVLIPSPKVATYDLQPEMSAPAVARKAVALIESGNYDVVILNFANCDMVGHTGSYDAAKLAVETVDRCMGTILDAAERIGGICLVTADHGNAEVMRDEHGAPMTAHTTNPVPFFVLGADVTLRNGRLADIAPTMLDLLGLEKPPEMDGQTLITN